MAKYRAIVRVSEKGVKMACSNVAHFHRKKFPGAASPTESLKVKQLLKTIKRRHRKPVMKREPATAEVVRALLQNFLPDRVNSVCALKNLRFRAF